MGSADQTRKERHRQAQRLHELVATVKAFLGRAWMLWVDRTAGPMRFRFVVQPIAAVVLAIRQGLRGAAQNRAPYLRSVWTDRASLVPDAWRDIASFSMMALVIDGVYRLGFLGWFYPVQALIVARAVAVVPYVVRGGPITRPVRACRWL